MSLCIPSGIVYLLKHNKLNMVKVGCTAALTSELREVEYFSNDKIPKRDIELVQEWVLPRPLMSIVEMFTQQALSSSRVEIAGVQDFFATDAETARAAVESAVEQVWDHLLQWKTGVVGESEERLEAVGFSSPPTSTDFDLTQHFTEEDDDTGEIWSVASFVLVFVELLVGTIARDPTAKLTVAEYLLIQKLFASLRIACPDYYDISEILANAEKSLLDRWRPPHRDSLLTDYLLAREDE